MRPMLGIGVAIFVLGLVLSAIGIVGVGADLGRLDPDVARAMPGDTSEPAGYLVIAVIAGLALACGALLLGLSFGNWRHPRAHYEPGDEIVDPEGHHKMKHV